MDRPILDVYVKDFHGGRASLANHEIINSREVGGEFQL